jgi:endonuclease YncB( thermonuclease family)
MTVTRFAKFKQFRGQILVTAFFLGIAGFTILLLVILIPNISHLRQTEGDTIARWKCMEVLAGDRIRVESHEGESHRIHVLGISCPPTNRSASAQAAVDRLGLPEIEVVKRGQVAQKTLYAWINKRLAFLLPGETQEDEEWLEAYVRVGGVDVGRQMLLHGQAYALDTPHRLLTEYKEYESKAKTKKIGLWRDP